MNRISGKPLKTRDSGTLSVAGNPCFALGLCQGSMGTAVTSGHSGHKSDPYVAVLTPAANGLTPMAVNVTSVVTVLTPPLVQCDPSEPYNVPIDVDINFDPNPILWTLENTTIPIRGHLTVLLLK